MQRNELFYFNVDQGWRHGRNFGVKCGGTAHCEIKVVIGVNSREIKSGPGALFKGSF